MSCGRCAGSHRRLPFLILIVAVPGPRASIRRRQNSMALAKRNEAANVTSDINVTPMVDVMLVLLIIFMVVTPMSQHGVQADMPKVNSPEDMHAADTDGALLVTITRDG